MNKQSLKAICVAAGLTLAAAAQAQIILYADDDFRGRSVNTDKAVDTFTRAGFNDRASSVVVLRERWEVCDDAWYGGRCVVLRPGRYPSMSAMGLNDRISSARPVHRDARFNDDRYAPWPPQPVYDSRRRNGERMYQANVTSARAVFGQPQQRCWVEREQVAKSNVPGAVAGALIGGILGHQIGQGSGRDVATAGGAVAGAAIGANVNRGTDTRDVRRCENIANQGLPQYWDVTYNFRGAEHHVQMTTPPGNSITVNAQGEPRS